MKIFKANTSDHELLTDITKKSKAYWCYSKEQMEIWSEALTITKDYIEKNETYKLTVDNSIIGYYSYLIEAIMRV